MDLVKEIAEIKYDLTVVCGINRNMKDLIELLNNHPHNKWNSIVRKSPTFRGMLSSKYTFTTSINEQIWLMMNNRVECPKCASVSCDNNVKWTNNNHYTNTCSPSCANAVKHQTGQWQSIQHKMQTTSMIKYGVKNAASLPDTQEKIINTKFLKYKSGQSPIGRQKAKDRSAELNIKGRFTLKHRYGVNNPSQIPSVKQKIKKTLFDNWGVDNVFDIPHVASARADITNNRWNELYQQITIISKTPDQTLSDIYPHACFRVNFQCNQCDRIDTLPSETFKFRFREYGTACSNCADIRRCRSKAEQEIADYIQSLGITIEQNNRSLIKPRELDIVCPNQKIAVEYCGLYWHSEIAGKDRKYHVTKHQQCSDMGIRLITIFEDEWINHPDIVKSRLKNNLGCNSVRYMARKLRLQSITNKIANDFCNLHHIQGAGRTSYAWGLFDSDKLVSVMTFSSMNIAKGGNASIGSWELNRFCVLSDCTVIGGASRLFAAAIKSLDPETIISYSDMRWNTGKLYQQLGFDFQHITPPNYWYINWKKCSRMHRFGFRKNIDDDQTLTEWENRKKQGLNRIWDCGNTKWIWSKK